MKHRRYNINNRRKMALVLLQRQLNKYVVFIATYTTPTSDYKLMNAVNQEKRIQSEIETLQSRIK